MTVAPTRTKLEARRLDAWFGATQALHGVELAIAEHAATAIIGPSGCGKSTLIRCLNRMHEIVPGARVSGEVLLDGGDIYGVGVDPVEVRARVGMVFQRPNPFPTMSIYDNVVAGLLLAGGRRSRADLDAIVERSLRQAALWGEGKDQLDASGGGISGGQHQRLCIARALAGEPEGGLMGEPGSALAPHAAP